MSKRLSRKLLVKSGVYVGIVLLLGMAACREDLVENPQQELKFFKLYGSASGQKAFECLQLKDGGYVIIGTKRAEGAESIEKAFLVKTNAGGNEIWSRALGTGASKGVSLDLTADGNIIALCEVIESGLRVCKVFIITPDNQVNLDVTIRPRPTFNYQPHRIRLGLDGGFVISGYSNDNTEANLDTAAASTNQIRFLTIKTTATGEVTHTFSRGYNQSSDRGNVAIQISENILIMAGQSTNKISGSEFINDVLWIKGGLRPDNTIVPEAAYNRGDITLKPDGNSAELVDIQDILSISPTRMAALGNTSTENGFLSFINPSGNTSNVGFVQFNIPGSTFFNSIQPTSDGGFILAGTNTGSGQGNGGKDMLMVKLNSFGGIQWFKVFGGTNDDEGYKAIQTTDGGYLLSGTLGFEAVPMMCLIKTDAEGNFE